MKLFHDWICIAWPLSKTGKIEGAAPITKELHSEEALCENEALAHFKDHWPGLRNYTVQPKTTGGGE